MFHIVVFCYIIASLLRIEDDMRLGVLLKITSEGSLSVSSWAQHPRHVHTFSVDASDCDWVIKDANMHLWPTLLHVDAMFKQGRVLLYPAAACSLILSPFSVSPPLPFHLLNKPRHSDYLKSCKAPAFHAASVGIGMHPLWYLYLALPRASQSCQLPTQPTSSLWHAAQWDMSSQVTGLRRIFLFCNLNLYTLWILTLWGCGQSMLHRNGALKETISGKAAKCRLLNNGALCLSKLPM